MKDSGMSDLNDFISYENGIYILRQQMPYPLQENNAYLAETDDGWMVIDLGIDIPGTRELWKTAVAMAGISFSSITKIILTHYHPDHLGAAAWLQNMTGAPVYMSDKDLGIASKYVFLREDRYASYSEFISGAVHLHSFGEEKTERLVSDWCDKVVPLFPAPEIIKILNEDDSIVINGFTYNVRIFSGHTDGQIALWCEDNRFLFSGDIFAENGYLHFTDWPHTNNINPLNDFLLSLTAIEEMNPSRIYTGHGKPVTEYTGVFSKLRKRHKKIIEAIEKSVSSPVSAGEIYELIFPVPQTGDYADYIHYHRVLIGEVVGYLNFLVSGKRLSSELIDGRQLYFAIG